MNQPLEFRTLQDMREAIASALDLPYPTEYSISFEFQVTPSLSESRGVPVGARAVKLYNSVYGYTFGYEFVNSKPESKIRG